jgi:hypothetical protein
MTFYRELPNISSGEGDWVEENVGQPGGVEEMRK